MKSRVEMWLNDVVTKKYRSLLEERRNEALKRMLNSGTLDQTKLPELGELKGFINAVDLMLDVEELENLFDGEINE